MSAKLAERTDSELRERLIDSHRGHCYRHTVGVASCPFCARIAAGGQRGTAAAVAFPDEFPVSNEHMLVVARRHIERIEDLSSDEWAELFALVQKVCQELAATPGVDGLNVGVNSGEAAGQTVAHAHVHVIPRRLGDVADPRGGVRHVIAEKAPYWEET